MEQKPRKVRRFIRRFVKITLLSLLLLVLGLYGLLQMHSVQTWLGKKVSAHLSKELNTSIAINAIRIDLFKKAHLEGVYVEDLHKDTLLYGNEITVSIALLSFTGKKLELDLTEINDMTVKLQKYKGEKDFNFQFLADYFASPDKDVDTTSGSFKIAYGDLQLNEVDLIFKDHNDTSKVPYGMNFSDLEARHISGKFSKISIDADLVKCRVENLSMHEKSGLNIKKLYTEATISPKSIRADNLYLITDNSYLHGYYQMHTDSFGSYSDFVNKVKLAVKLTDSSFVNPLDVSYFVTALKGFDEKINLSGTFSGPVNHMQSGNLKFSAYEHTAFNGSFDIEGLPNIDSTYVKFTARKLSTHYFDLVRVPEYPFDAGKSMTLPSNIKALGRVTFTGKAEGYLHDLFMTGVFNTALGQLAVKAGVQTWPGKEIAYNGDFNTAGFNVGPFIQAKDLGMISMNAKMSGSGTTLKTLAANIDGQIHTAHYNNYVYHHFDINGNFKNRKFTGYFSSADTNANFKFTGSADLSKKIPEVNAAIEIFRFDLYKTHFITNDSVAVLSGTLRADLSGQTIDDLNGTLRASELKLKRSNGLVKIENTDLVIVQDETHNNLSMISSAFDAEIDGRFTVGTLQKSITHFMHEYFPTFVKEKNTVTKASSKKIKPNTDNFKFKVRVKDFSPVATFLKMPLTISPNTVLQGSFDAQKNSMVASGVSDIIEYNKIPIRDWFLSINTSNREVQLNTGFKKVDLGDSIWFDNFDIKLVATDNKSDFKILWDNETKKKNSGQIEGNLVFSQYYLDLDVQKFVLYAEDSLWQRVGSDHIFADSSGTINFSDLAFVNNKQKIKVEGVISKNPKEQVTFELERFRLSQFNPILKRKGITLGGSITGKANIADMYKKFLFSSAFTFRRLKLNGTLIGNGEVNTLYDEAKEVVSLNGNFKRDFIEVLQTTYNNINFDGYYYPNKKDSALDISLHLSQFAINTLQPFVKGIFTLNEGYINGNATIKGSLSKPQLRGEMELADVKNFKVDYLNAPYSIKTGKIKIEPDEITLDFVNLYDQFNNKAVVYGNIFHDNFTNMKLDFDINATNFMAMNTTSAQNTSYYGKAFCTGNIGLYGPPDALIFEINAKTAKGTQFYIPLSGPGEVSESGFIRFVKPDSLKNKADDKNDFSGITLKFNLEVSPNAEVQILLDAKSGDAIKARGIGTINMNISTHGNFEMFGTYDILDGSYLFTLENVINKKFDIDEGSSIRWSGDPLNADINIVATYKQRTSLAAFFPQMEANSASGSTATSSAVSGVDNNKRYPVECKLYMRDKLLTPDITFGIELPGVSEVIRSQVMGYINNEQELNRQVFSLLLLRSFVTPLQLTATSGVSAGGAVGNNASELLSNQINNWLSNFTKVFNMGVNYRPGSGQSNEELEMNVSTALFNDKLTIDGNVGVNNNTQTKTSTLIGDLNINYKLTQDGKIQLKAFNRSNDNFQIATLGGQFTQGAGVFYREEFNNLNDLYKRYVNFLTRKRKKAQSIPN